MDDTTAMGFGLFAIIGGSLLFFIIGMWIIENFEWKGWGDQDD